jgi:hypothetical protein
MGAIGEEGVDKPGDAARDPGDDPSTKYQENGARLVTLALRCHNSQKDAPDHKAGDAVYPVVPIFRHVVRRSFSSAHAGWSGSG